MKEANPYTNEYYELYAKLSLETLYDEKYKQLNKSEKPDWQNDQLGIGLEVTRGISEYQGMTDSIGQKYFGKGYASEDIIHAVNKKYSRFKGSIKKIHNATVLSTHKGLYDFTTHIANVKNKYLEKTVKLNIGYTVYRSNQLYIFTASLIDETDVKMCMDISLNNYRVNFDITFLNCQDKIYVCDFTACRIIDFIEIDHDTQRKLKRIAFENSQRA